MIERFIGFNEVEAFVNVPSQLYGGCQNHIKTACVVVPYELII